MPSPYENLDDRAYWRSGVAQRSPLDPGDLYQPRFAIARTDRIMTAGSCFAQHVGRTLREHGFNVMDAETVPDAVPDAVARKFGYRLYSARYGNVYTARQLLQLLQEAEGSFTPADPVWRAEAGGGGYFDAFRPSVEPEGLPGPEDVAAHRRGHLAAVRELLANLDVLVFTFGLTEAWISREDGAVYPTAPGTIAGTFDPARHAFHNFTFAETMSDFVAVRRIIKRYNPRARFLVTVSPVPLTATASGRHVEVASCYSKSVLRAVCGTLYERFDDLDYFPSYEIITSQTARGAYYEPNLRSVTATGVGTAMGLFMKAHGNAAETPGPERGRGSAAARRKERAARQAADEDLVCEDALLEGFARK